MASTHDQQADPMSAPPLTRQELREAAQEARGRFDYDTAATLERCALQLWLDELHAAGNR